jgi:hypothetical protein
MKFGIISAVIVLLNMSVFAIEPEPNWTNRYEEIKTIENGRFSAPQIGESITVIRRVGGEYSGQVAAITKETITVGSETFRVSQLTSESCDKIFSEIHAMRIARKRTLDERTEYADRKTAEQVARQVIESRQARERQLQQEAEQQRAAEQEKILEQKAKILQAQADKRSAIANRVVKIILYIFVAVLSVGLYFLPSIIAFKRGHPNAGAILVLNIFLGWTGLGWIGALVWSFTAG